MDNRFQKIFKSPNGSIFHHTMTPADGRILTRPFETHDQYEILYLINGKVSYQIEGRRYLLEPGDAIIVGIGELHNLIVDLSL
ncbi:MAG: AraC family ligand binding domain-containing protein, partial [Bacilli bacterium]|nr:AraC family ligand binding domain-containing protein [Bacilli bacterium]